MMREATVQSRVLVTLSGQSNRYQSPVSQFYVDMVSPFGPAPGALLVPTHGLVVDLSMFTRPGLAVLTNQDPTNFVTYGVYDPNSGNFFPWGEVLPLEGYPFRFSRVFGEDYAGTGTGTPFIRNNTFMIKADTAPCKVNLDVFEA